MHGGAKGSGAPIGNTNAFKHGMYTKVTKEFNRHIKELTVASKDLIERM